MCELGLLSVDVRVCALQYMCSLCSPLSLSPICQSLLQGSSLYLLHKLYTFVYLGLLISLKKTNNKHKHLTIAAQSEWIAALRGQKQQLQQQRQQQHQ